MTLPVIIQGGMGVGVSGWQLAAAVSRAGQLGVVSGTALDVVLARRLQTGDPGGHMRRGLAAFPFQTIARRILDRYFLPGGRSSARAFVPLPLHGHPDDRALVELVIAANFVEVWLAREGHAGPVGINYLEKIQVPHLPSLYGALLADVDYILMGAGIPMRIPAAIDALLTHSPATYPLTVTEPDRAADTVMTFDPLSFVEGPRPVLRRPRFLPIVSSHILAATLARKAPGPVDGFIVEGPTAGGHNAPPRGRLQLTVDGEPVYGERDVVDLEKMRALGLPFWLAGGFATPERLREAIAAGAQGIQVGTAFALAEESGMRSDLRAALRTQARDGTARVMTDPLASPTSFPLKVAQMPGTIADRDVYESRARVCDLGYLREAYRKPDGTVGFRCPAEPVHAFTGKGGAREATTGRKCICNALLATVGLGQRRGPHDEPPLVTCGDAVNDVSVFMTDGRLDYSAADVVRYLLDGTTRRAADRHGV